MIVARPAKPESGVKVIVPPARATVPCPAASIRTAVRASVWSDSFGGPGRPFASTDATLSVSIGSAAAVAASGPNDLSRAIGPWIGAPAETSVSVKVREPVFAPDGSTVIVYVPATGSVNADPDPVAADTDNVETVPPLGWRTVKTAPGIVFPVTDSVRLCDAAPVNERTAFSPGVPIVTVVGVPIDVVPVLSGTLLRANVSEPVFWPCGSTVTVYVPATGSVKTCGDPGAPDTNRRGTVL